MVKFVDLVKKNFKNLFRSLGSVFVLVIGPFLLILVLVGAFSDIGFQDITIGYVGQRESIEPLVTQISYLGEFQHYDALDACKDHLKNQQIHLCMDVSAGDITNIDLYFDNTREIISYILISQTRRGVEREKQEVLKGKTYSFIEEVREVNVFINQKQDNILDIIDEIEEYKQDIKGMQSQITQTLSELNSHISRLENLRQNILDAQNQVNSAYDSMTSEARSNIDEVISELQSVRSTLLALGQSTYTLDKAILDLNTLDSNLVLLGAPYSEVNTEINNVVFEIDNTLGSLRQARDFLADASIKLNQIDQSLSQRITELHRINNELGQKRSGLSQIEQLNVEHLINPYALNFQPLYEGSERAQRLQNLDLDISERRRQQLVSIGSVQTLLPVVIALMICFVAVIIANMIALDEIHSPAYTRNRIMPVPWFTKLSAIIFTLLVILMIQVGVILAIGYFVFFLDLAANLGVILLTSALLVIIYSLLGISLAYLVNTPTTSLLVSAFFLIINIFLSGLAFPVERMSPIMLKISLLIPFRDGLSIFQQSIFYQIGFSALSDQITRLAILAVLSGVFLLFSYWIFKRRYERGL